MKRIFRFTNDFVWGAAVSAHQVEGNNENNLTVWEKKNAKNLAAIAQKRFAWNPCWKEMASTMTCPDNYISGIAVNHYKLYKQDIKLMKELNLNAFRFSIEWSRIEPEKGVFDKKEIEYYRKYIKELKKNGIEPFVTLYHWTIPIWVEKEGGVLGKHFVSYFSEFVSRVVREYKDGVKFWITINEPQAMLFGLLDKYWMFKFSTPFKHIRAYLKLINTHNKVSRIIKGIDNCAQIGLANHCVSYSPKTKSIQDILGASFLNWWQNLLVFSRTRRYSDFLGINQYFRAQIHNFKMNNEDKLMSEMGWEIYEHGMYPILQQMKRFKLPVYITESGLADGKDVHRGWYIKETLKDIDKAIVEGIDVRGYFHWSLLDNFEWNSGYWPKFGLIEVNRETMERKVRDSGREYAEIIENSGFAD